MGKFFWNWLLLLVIRTISAIFGFTLTALGFIFGEKIALGISLELLRFIFFFFLQYLLVNFLPDQ